VLSLLFFLPDPQGIQSRFDALYEVDDACFACGWDSLEVADATESCSAKPTGQLSAHRVMQTLLRQSRQIYSGQHSLPSEDGRVHARRRPVPAEISMSSSSTWSMRWRNLHRSHRIGERTSEGPSSYPKTLSYSIEGSLMSSLTVSAASFWIDKRDRPA